MYLITNNIQYYCKNLEIEGSFYEKKYEVEV